MAQTNEGFCPLDRTPLNALNIHDLFPTPLIITNMVDELKVYCLNFERGCDWIGSRWELEHHVVQDCGFTGVYCDGVRIRLSDAVELHSTLTDILEEEISLELLEDAELEEHSNEIITALPTERCCSLLVERRFLGSENNECVHKLFECKFCKTKVTAINEEVHLKEECLVNYTTCDLCNNDMIPLRNLEKHKSNCMKTGKLVCPAHKIGCPWVGNNEPSLEIHLEKGNCQLNQLLPFMSSLENKIDKLGEENAFLQKQIHKILDSIIQGKVTNLGYNEPIEEIGRFTRDMGIMEDQDRVLHLNYEIDRLKCELEEKINPFIDRESNAMIERETIMNGLVSDNFIMKDNLNLQRALINSLRKQVQFLLFRNRNQAPFGANFVNHPTPGAEADDILAEMTSMSSSEERLNLKL